MDHSRSAVAKAPRAPRADARRNRETILLTARQTFEKEGVFASLDGIAQRAGVGNATLYRNFPTRDDLLAAVIESSIAAALAKAQELTRQLAPREALLEWLILLTWQLRTWHDLPDCVATAQGDPASSMNSACEPLRIQTGVLLDQAKGSGDVVDAVTAIEVFELVTVLSWGVDRFHDDRETAQRRVEIGTAGIFDQPQQPQHR